MKKSCNWYCRKLTDHKRITRLSNSLKHWGTTYTNFETFGPVTGVPASPELQERRRHNRSLMTEALQAIHQRGQPAGRAVGATLGEPSVAYFLRGFLRFAACCFLVAHRQFRRSYLPSLSIRSSVVPLGRGFMS